MGSGLSSDGDFEDQDFENEQNAFVSQRCQSAFLEMHTRRQERRRYIIDTRFMYRKVSGPLESSSSPMHLPQVGSSDNAYDQMSVCQRSDISHARVWRNYSLRKLHGSTQPL